MNRLSLSFAALAACTTLTSLVHAQVARAVIASGLTRPLYVTSPPNDARLFIVEQAGRIKIRKNGAVLPGLFLDIVAKVNSTGNERGLLGLAFHPSYATNGLFYVSYTRAGDAASILERYQVSANPDVANAASAAILYGPIAQPFSNHNGGCIQFGPDGYLYLGLGDGGSAGDPGCRAQSTSNPLGKMLRLDIDHPTNRVPPTNPFVGNTAYAQEIWALGMRNPWRFSFDRANGDLWIGDVGQNAVEEIDWQPGTSTGGENYGWNSMEGNACYSSCLGAPPCNSPLLTRPVHTYSHASGCSVTGGYVYRGCAMPALHGTYFFGDYCSGTVWSFRLVGGVVTGLTTQGALATSSLASFGEDADGELYLVSLSGVIYKIVPTVPTAIDLGFGKVGGNGLIPLFSVCGSLATGQNAEFRLDDAPANASAAFIVGLTNNPTSFPPFGTLVPNPPLFSVGFVTDNDGSASFSLPGRTSAAVVYAQWIVIDAGATGGLGVSNAQQVFYR